MCGKRLLNTDRLCDCYHSNPRNVMQNYKNVDKTTFMLKKDNKRFICGNSLVYVLKIVAEMVVRNVCSQGNNCQTL